MEVEERKSYRTHTIRLKLEKASPLPPAPAPGGPIPPIELSFIPPPGGILLDPIPGNPAPLGRAPPIGPPGREREGGPPPA